MKTSSYTKYLVPLTLLYFCLWYILSLGNNNAVRLGVVFALLSALCSTFLLSRTNKPQASPSPAGRIISPLGLLKFLRYFLYNAALSGFDVARLVLRRELDFQTHIIDYHCRLPSERAVICFAYVMNLLPGTLTIKIAPTQLQVHSLVQADLARQQLCTLEQTIADIFGLTLSATSPTAND